MGRLMIIGHARLFPSPCLLWLSWFSRYDSGHRVDQYRKYGIHAPLREPCDADDPWVSVLLWRVGRS